jgi:hypothetical protein
MLSSFKQTNPKRERFSKAEDFKLMNLVQQYGNRNWNQIALQMDQRNARQCKDRWEGFLSPTINKSAWTIEEDILLIQKIKEFGTKWKILTIFFPNRSDTSLKNRFHHLGNQKSIRQDKDQHQELKSKEKSEKNIFEGHESAESPFEEFSFFW